MFLNLEIEIKQKCYFCKTAKLLKHFMLFSFLKNNNLSID